MRVAEGLAAGVLQPIPAIVVLHAFGAGERGKAMGIFRLRRRPRAWRSARASAASWSSGAGWRSIFFVVTPFCADRVG